MLTAEVSVMRGKLRVVLFAPQPRARGERLVHAGGPVPAGGERRAIERARSALETIGIRVR